MIDLTLVRTQSDLIREALAARQEDAAHLDRLITLDNAWRAATTQRETLRAEQKRASRGGNGTITAALKTLAEQVKNLDEQTRILEAEINDLSLQIPNLPHPSVPRGSDANANAEIKRWGTPRTFPFPPLSHVELGERLGILDLGRGVKLAQTRFHLLVGLGERLERALVNFMLDLHIEQHGYTALWLPELANTQTMIGCGQLPKFGQQLFRCADDDLYLIPTAESNLAGLHAGEILAVGVLPLSYVAHTHCFRREAGASGQDTRGMIRVHQFDKVELFKYTEPEKSYEALEELTRHAEVVLEKLDLPYRRVLLSTGDMGFGAAKTYDLEVYLPSYGTYREISSCSNVGDFQARRNQIRYRPAPGAKPRYVHMLNGSGLAVGRTFVAILENYQQADGSVIIPPVLRPYMGGREVIGVVGA